MAWIVDGNNLLAQVAGRSRNDPQDRRHLAATLSRFCEARRQAMTLFFDGAPLRGWRGTSWLGRLRVAHSGPGRSADSAILDEVAASPRAAEMNVVTSDRALADRCRAMGARVTSVREMRSILAASEIRAAGGEKPDRLDPGGDRVVAKAGGLREDEDARPGLRLGASGPVERQHGGEPEEPGECERAERPRLHA